MTDIPAPEAQAEQVVRLDDVVVTAARLPPSAAEAAFSVVGLTQDDLRNGVRIDEALQSVPAVSLFRRTSSFAANPTTQGLSLRAIAPSGAGRALVTLDGVPLNDPFGGWVIWAQATTESLSGIDIIRGAGAGPYGAGALTGVVSLRERDADGGVLDISAAERGGLRAAGSISESHGRTALTLSGVHEHSDGYIPVRGPAAGQADVPMDITAEALSARFDYRVAEDIRLSVRGATWEEDRGSGLGANRANASGHSLSATLAKTPTSGALGWRLQAWRTQSNLYNSSGSVSANRSAVTPANEQYRTPAEGYGFNAALRRKTSLSTGELEWEVGADARFTEGQTQELFRFMNQQFTRGRRAGGQASVAGFYGDLSWTNPRWLIAGGIRIDHWTNENGFRFENDLQSGTVLLDESETQRTDEVISARLGIRRHLNDAWAIRAAAYSGFRPATLNELHRPFRVGNDLTEANALLVPETLQGTEFGLAYDKGGVALGGTVFWNRIDDAIVNVTLAEGPGTFPRAGPVPEGGVLRQRQNAGTIDAIGLELSARLQASDALSVYGALSWTDAKMDGGTLAPQLTGLRPAQAPQWSGNFGFDWKAAKDLRLSAMARYESERFDDDLNSRVLNDMWTVDARAEWQIIPNAMLWLAADNLLDADNETAMTATGIASYTAMRTLRFGVRLSY